MYVNMWLGPMNEHRSGKDSYSFVRICIAVQLPHYPSHKCKICGGRSDTGPPCSPSLSVLPRQWCYVVQCMIFGRWRREWSWRTTLLGVGKWRRVGVYLLKTSVWQGQVYLRRRRGPNQTWVAPSLPFVKSTDQKPFTAVYQCSIFIQSTTTDVI
jgi:hypothetical protein